MSMLKIKTTNEMSRTTLFCFLTESSSFAVSSQHLLFLSSLDVLMIESLH